MTFPTKLSIFKTIAVFGAILIAQPASAATQTAIFAGGCFWCVESDFESVTGVTSAESGFTGGTTDAPTYRSHGDHIEAVKIIFDDALVDYDTLLHHFFRSVDPTDAGGQFCDRGHAYTTGIFAFDPAQTQSAELAKQQAATDLNRDIATPIYPASVFYPVSDYHQDYYKSDETILSRFGFVTKADAYKRYRKGCGRDAKVKLLWGDAAPFAH